MTGCGLGSKPVSDNSQLPTAKTIFRVWREIWSWQYNVFGSQVGFVASMSKRPRSNLTVGGRPVWPWTLFFVLILLWPRKIFRRISNSRILCMPCLPYVGDEADNPCYSTKDLHIPINVCFAVKLFRISWSMQTEP